MTGTPSRSGQLGDRRCLSGPIDADDQRDERNAALVDLDPAVAHRCLEQSDHLLTQRLACLDRVADLATSHALLESF
jgi:hypothetical protein